MQKITRFRLQLVEGTYNDEIPLERLRGAFEEIIKVFLFLQGLLSGCIGRAKSRGHLTAESWPES